MNVILQPHQLAAEVAQGAIAQAREKMSDTKASKKEITKAVNLAFHCIDKMLEIWDVDILAEKKKRGKQ